MVRANMAHAGALRIDHVMGLARLFWVPPGGKPADGAYVRYPFDDLLGIIALESCRQRCMVIGEDLGTVPDEVRAGLARTGVLSYRLLLFERDHAGQFKPPADYPREALAACSTHDLPTLAGWWAGRDIEWRASLGLFPDDESRRRQVVARAQDRALMLVALEREGLLPEGASVVPNGSDLSPAIARALHVYACAQPVAHHGDPAGRRHGRGRAGQSSGHGERASQLAAQAAGFARTLRRGAAIPCALRGPCGNARPVTAGAQAARPARCRGERAAGDVPRTAQSRFHLPRCSRAGAVPRPAGHQPPLYVADPARAFGQHPWLRHRRPRRAQPGDRLARRLRRASPTRCVPAAWACCSTSCPTTWA